MDDSHEVGNFVKYKPVYLPGSLITFIVSYLSLFFTIVFSIILVYEFSEGTDIVNGELRGMGEILFMTSIISYLSFSYRIVISRNRDVIIIWRQFITSQFQFERGEYAVNSLHIEEFTKIGGDDDSEYNYTTIYSGNQEVITYAGTKKQILHLVPELLIEKSDSDDIDEVATQPFWSDFSKDS
tara:strand:- start:50 stop:598 length:549 start_codon:yes stop_codon:yes gene_type:complete